MRPNGSAAPGVVTSLIHGGLGQIAYQQERLFAAGGEFEQALPDALWFQQQLALIGFSLAFSGQFDEQTRNVLAAFQMKYRPARHDGEADAEKIAA